MTKKLQRKVAPARQPAAAVQKAPSERRPMFGGQRITARVLTEFTSQLAVLLDAGIPVTKCLRILEGQMPAGGMKRTLAAVIEDVESGTSLSEALAKYPGVFDRLYTNMVRAGEAGGVQDEILNRLAAFMEKAEAIKGRVRNALAYPVMVSVIALSVLVLVFVFVIPKFKEIFEQQFPAGIAELPWQTQLVIAIGEFLESRWWVFVLVLLVLYGTHRLLLSKVHRYRRMRDLMAMRIPVFGSLINKSLVARFSRTFGTLIQSGVPHLEALDIVEASVANVPMTESVRRIHGSISEGAGIAVPMGQSGIFDDIIVNMVDVGEQTGELDRMLTKIADRYEAEVDRAVDTTFKIIEPVLLVVMAVIVGFIVFALFMPLLKLMEKMG